MKPATPYQSITNEFILSLLLPAKDGLEIATDQDQVYAATAFMAIKGFDKCVQKTVSPAGAVRIRIHPGIRAELDEILANFKANAAKGKFTLDDLVLPAKSQIIRPNGGAAV